YAARGGKTDAQSRETAGPGRRSDAIKRRKGDASFLHHPRDQRHQRLGVAALHRLRFLRDQSVLVGVEHSSGASFERGVDGEDQHGQMLALVFASPKTWMPGTRPG